MTRKVLCISTDYASIVVSCTRTTCEGHALLLEVEIKLRQLGLTSNEDNMLSVIDEMIDDTLPDIKSDTKGYAEGQPLNAENSVTRDTENGVTS